MMALLLTAAPCFDIIAPCPDVADALHPIKAREFFEERKANITVHSLRSFLQ